MHRCIEEACNSRISHQAVLSFSAQAHMGMREYSRAASVLGKDQQSPAAVFFRRLNVGRWNDKWVIKETIVVSLTRRLYLYLTCKH